MRTFRGINLIKRRTIEYLWPVKQDPVISSDKRILEKFTDLLSDTRLGSPSVLARLLK
jgi:hypothetical protein